MKILAIEFSTEQRSAAVVDAEVAATPVLLGQATETNPRTVGPLALIEQTLHTAGLERETVDCLAVGLGPGSYTGIRAAIALAQGWQIARGIRLLGLGSVECLAALAHSSGWRGRVSFVFDAQRGELYLTGCLLRETDWEITEPLRLATVAEAKSRGEQGDILAGPEVTRWFPAGRILFPSAAMLGRLAAARGDFVPGEKLEPVYLRETTFVKAPPPRVRPA